MRLLQLVDSQSADGTVEELLEANPERFGATAIAVGDKSFPLRREHTLLSQKHYRSPLITACLPVEDKQYSKVRGIQDPSGGWQLQLQELVQHEVVSALRRKP